MVTSQWRRIWRTTNGGTTWTIGHSGMGSNARVYNICLHSNGFLYASSNVGLYISNDGGLNWRISSTMNYSCYAHREQRRQSHRADHLRLQVQQQQQCILTDATGASRFTDRR